MNRFSMTPCRGASWLLGLILAPLLLQTAGCSVNPATGRSQLMLISEAQELEMGREADPQIVAQFGLYPDQKIQDYVSALGRDLAEKSERPNLDWEFKVLDDPLVNAFALPGGYVYITRGIMSHMDSESELAGVLGHEIGHVVARHSANQISKQQLATVGLVVGAILLDPEDRWLAGVAGIGAQLAFLKFSRDDERQADDLGLRYLDRLGFDPRPMPGVFQTLGRVAEAAGGSGMPNWLGTHPAPENRVVRLEAQIAELGGPFDGRRVGREPFMASLNGMTFGDDPRQGFFKDNVFYHPDLALKIEFPEGWTTQNTRSAVLALSPDEDAMMVFSLAEQDTLEAAETAFFEDDTVVQGPRWTPAIRGFTSIGRDFEASGEQKLKGKVAFIAGPNRIFQMLTYGTDSRWSRHDQRVVKAIGSFEELTDRRYLDVQSAKLRIVEIDQAMTLEEFQRRNPSTIDLQTLAIINAVEEGDTLPAGTLVKRVVGGEIP